MSSSCFELQSICISAVLLLFLTLISRKSRTNLLCVMFVIYLEVNKKKPRAQNKPMLGMKYPALGKKFHK